MLQKLRSNKEGFTLIELMIVIAIIGILAAIAIPNFISYRNKAYCSAAENDAHAVAAALADYYAIPTNNSVPTVAGLNVTLSPGNTGTINGPMNTIVITVTDGSARCPGAYQANNNNWAGGQFTLNMQ